MIVSIISGIIVVFEIVFIISFISYAKRHKTAVSKNTVFWFIPVFLFVLTLYLVGYIHSNPSIKIPGLINNISIALRSFAFEIRNDSIQDLLDNNILFALAFYVAYFLAVITVIGSAIGFTKNHVANIFRVKLIIRNSCDIVIGYNESSLEYINNNKDNTILWINNPVSKDQINYLNESQICFINTPLKHDKLKKIGLKEQVRYNFIVFDVEEQKYQELIDEFVLMNQNNRIVFLYMEVKYQEMEVVRNEYLKYKNKFEETRQKSSEKQQPNCNLFIRTFSRYELISRKFVENITIPALIPNTFFNENKTIKDDKEINVIFCGFGKVNASLLSMMCQNNQLVKQVENKLRAKLVNYYSIDRNFDSASEKRIDYIINNASKYENDFEQPEPLCNYIKINRDLNSADALENIKEITSKENSYNIIIVSYGSDYENAETAMWFYNEFNPQNTKIACRLKKTRIINEDIIYFGNELEVLSRKFIIDEELQQLAKDINFKYSSFLDKCNLDMERYWDKLDQVELYSNYYSAMNIRFKLNLLGLDLTKDPIVEGITKDDFIQIYNEGGNNDNSYVHYFDTKIRNVIAYSEKLRWNAYYLFNGYKPMAKSRIDFEKIEKDGKVKYVLHRKDHSLKQHACITSHAGLDDLHKHIVNHKTNSNNKRIEDIDFYKYDYLIFDNPEDSLIDNLFRLGYKITYLQKM